MGNRGKPIIESSNGVTHLTEPVDVDDDGAIFYITTVSAGARNVLSVTPHNLLAGIERQTRAYNKWAKDHREALAIRTPPVTVELLKKE